MMDEEREGRRRNGNEGEIYVGIEGRKNGGREREREEGKDG